MTIPKCLYAILICCVPDIWVLRAQRHALSDAAEFVRLLHVDSKDRGVLILPTLFINHGVKDNTSTVRAVDTYVLVCERTAVLWVPSAPDSLVVEEVAL